MSFEVLGDLNWLAVIVATVAYFALGGLWYAGPVFGRAWTRASGIQVPEGGPGPIFYAVPLLINLIATVATAMIAAATGSDTVSEGIVLGLVVGVGYAVALTALSATFDTRPEPKTWFAISAGYHLVGLVIVAVIVSIWT